MSDEQCYEDQQLLRFIILSQEAGGIIGKEGRNIRQIRDESSCIINISGSASQERVLNVTGKPHEIKNGVEMVAEKLKEMSNVREEAPIMVRLLIPNSQCGCVIGKQGASIKAIREKSGVQISIPSESLPGSTERAVTITGHPEQVGSCCEQIAVKFIENPLKQNNIQYYPNIVPQNSMPQLSMMTGQLSLSGMSRRSEQKVRLPSNVIGSLIGKAGCHINEIRQFSGATVQIEENERDEKMSDVIISGTPEAVSCATFLINARISAGQQQAQARSRGDNQGDNRDNRRQGENRQGDNRQGDNRGGNNRGNRRDRRDDKDDN